ncbi:Phenazine biosynthesis-like domain-containing protein [Fukomys damarensis]|uniref:Phenazine biosynthesis-like domain-containing protein n=1 Tax=Fukomys damarensis TaxID=885580 RepID=A0A091DBG9_FUKDA|nr:Phenazine biosynthesis-like domain-containing protein [Fukomys damarensis]
MGSSWTCLYPTQPKELREVENLAEAAAGSWLVQDVCCSPVLESSLSGSGFLFLDPESERGESDTSGDHVGAKDSLSRSEETRRAGRSTDFYSGYCAPWVCVAGDPVTGSACTVVSSY